MGLRKKYENPIPGKNKPKGCRFKLGGGKTCDKEANHPVDMTLDLMGKEVNVKIMFCDEHYKKVIGVEFLSVDKPLE